MRVAALLAAFATAVALLFACGGDQETQTPRTPTSGQSPVAGETVTAGTPEALNRQLFAIAGAVRQLEFFQKDATALADFGNQFGPSAQAAIREEETAFEGLAQSFEMLVQICADDASQADIDLLTGEILPKFDRLMSSLYGADWDARLNSLAQTYGEECLPQ